MTKTSKSRLFRGVCIAAVLILCVAVIFFVRMGFAYDGKCGGFLPEVSGQRACSWWGYMTGDVPAIALIVAVTYWPVFPLLIVMGMLMGYFTGRRGRRDDAF